ncbi:MAG: TVP38/TMEM64 family protein [Coriobacteriia bacterium]|nr:TVP38/TMEM64 family protein [Coriobacteriia bacterium]
MAEKKKKGLAPNEVIEEVSDEAAPDEAPDEAAPGEAPDEAPDETPDDETSAKIEKKGIAFADKLKFIGLVVFILLLVGLGILLMPYFTYFASAEGRLELVQIIKDAHIWGILICLGLQFLQVVVAFIPGEVTQIAIGAIYGPFWGTLITALGALIPTIFIYYVVHKLGAPFVHGMISKKHEDKLRFLQESRKLDIIVFILFLIPALPKDTITYLVSLTNMRPLNFFVLSTLGRIPGIALTAYIGSAAVQGNYTSAIVVAIIGGALLLIGVIFNKKIMALIDAVEHRFRRKK